MKSCPSENKLKTHCWRGHLFDEANTYYYKNRRICKQCDKGRQPSEKRKAYQKRYWKARLANDPEAIRHLNERQRRYNARIRAETLGAYGGEHPKCACCREGEKVFLALDHVNGGGAAERKRLGIGGGVNLYRWLKQRGWPKNGYQLLCHNCNMARGMQGVCPHELQRKVP